MNASPAVAPSLFVPPGHHYSPIVDPAEAGRHLARLEARPVPERLPGIAPSTAAMRALWAQWLPLFASMPFAAQPHAGLRYGFDNPNFAWGDGSVLHAMLRHLRPRMYIEIGSGWSSACAVDTIEGWLDGRCEAVLVDPYPDLARRLVGSARLELTVVEQEVQAVPLEVYALLQAGDVLFIDSTHVLRTGSDVCFELFEVLPRLAAGVVVHLHDVFWPFEYPRAWVIDDNRSWNELYALRAFLADNDQWEILFFNDFFARMERGLIQGSFPAFLRNSGGSLWLRRR